MVRDKPRMGREIDDYLKQWRGICPMILQHGMRHNLKRNIPLNYILARQRALGLRRVSQNPRKSDRVR
jgi:hypothetical protein